MSIKHPEAGEAPQSWFTGLKAKLGLPGTPTLRETLENALKTAGEADEFSPEEREMLLRILRFGTLQVEDVMVPRADIIAVDENESIRELLEGVRRRRRVAHAALPRDPGRAARHGPRQGRLHWLIGDARGRPAGAAGKASESGAAGKASSPAQPAKHPSPVQPARRLRRAARARRPSPTFRGWTCRSPSPRRSSAGR